MKRIGIISDTHGVVHPALRDVFAHVDHIVHAGDIGGAHVLEALRELAPVTSVDGNNDVILSREDGEGSQTTHRSRRTRPFAVSAAQGDVAAARDEYATGEDILRLELGTLRILLTHILPRPRKLAARVVASLREAPADVVVFGHSHLPHNEVVAGVRYFNPASSGPRRFNFPVSVGLFEKKGRAWTATHVALDERSVEALHKWMNQLSKR